MAYTYAELKPGDEESVSKTITAADICCLQQSREI